MFCELVLTLSTLSRFGRDHFRTTVRYQSKFDYISLHSVVDYITYFGYFGIVYPRSRKGHQMSDHLVGE